MHSKQNDDIVSLLSFCHMPFLFNHEPDTVVADQNSNNRIAIGHRRDQIELPIFALIPDNNGKRS